MLTSRKHGQKAKYINGRKIDKENKNKNPKSNKIYQALTLPSICNINPRSIYNKLEEFQNFVIEEELDSIFISESWERDDLTLDKVIKLDDHIIISNVSQRRGKGGRPALIVNKQKYTVQNLTNTVINIPWGVEAIWCVLTPKNVTNDSKIQKIACCSLYSKPDSRKKTLLLDHISDAYNILNKKYGKGLEFIIAGDTNDLNLDPILSLNPRFCQIVKDWTRMDPPAILDPIITTLANYYQKPECLEPLDADPETGGKKSDHKIVVARAITEINNKPARAQKEVKVRPITDSGMSKLQEWFVDQTWESVFKAESAHEKAALLQDMLMGALNKFLPEKTMKITSNDQPWISHRLKVLDRKRKRIFHKERRSERWKVLNKDFKKEIKNAKSDFYKKAVADLKTKNPGQWYSCLKKITSYDKNKEQVDIDEIRHLEDQEQAEAIADKFTSIPNDYDALKSEDISIPHFSSEDIPQFEPSKVWQLLCKLKTNKTTVQGDFPARLSKKFAAYIAEPLTDVINTSIRRGEYPKIYKFEISTPVPKHYPPRDLTEIRNISGLLTYDKIMESLLADMIISDMKPHMDPAQYGNQKGVSIQHYLIDMIHRILTALDGHSKSESFAVIANLIDWDNAFPRQCPKLGIQSFIKNGVRPALIPVLVNYFQEREMSVKWHGHRSARRKVKGGGPQGATIGLLEYLSQSNNCADIVSESERFRFLDDLSLLEIINLLIVGLASYNIKLHIPSDIGTHNQHIPSQNLKSQQWLDCISDWTNKQKMKINVKKTKCMVFNYSNKHQFSPRLEIDGEPIEVIDSTRLLGTIITNDLRWDQNTSHLVKKANARMELLRRVASFGTDIQDLKTIYILFVRSQLEQSSVVWHSSLTEQQKNDLERVQKSALKIILGAKYESYQKALNILDLEPLDQRRDYLCLKFAQKCMKNEKTKQMFPLNEKDHNMDLRKTEKFKVMHANTDRLKKSPIIYMQHLLNQLT